MYRVSIYAVRFLSYAEKKIWSDIRLIHVIDAEFSDGALVEQWNHHFPDIAS